MFDFVALEVSRRNYLKWTQDVKIHLTAKKMRSTINANNVIIEAFNMSAIIFKKETYGVNTPSWVSDEEDTQTLWVALEEHFHHQMTIFLLEARHDWQNEINSYDRLPLGQSPRSHVIRLHVVGTMMP